MSATAPVTLADSQVAMLKELSEVLSKHPAGATVRLMVTPEAIVDTPETVYVQCRPDAEGIIRLYPRPITDLQPGEVMHSTQIINPTDSEFNEYTAARRYACATNCGTDSLTGTHQYG